MALPKLSNELYEHYPAMSAQTHEGHVKEYGKACVLQSAARATELTAALQTALVAMKIASALPGVAEEYDFADAIKAAETALNPKGCTE